MLVAIIGKIKVSKSLLAAVTIGILSFTYLKLAGKPQPAATAVAAPVAAAVCSVSATHTETATAAAGMFHLSQVMVGQNCELNFFFKLL